MTEEQTIITIARSEKPNSYEFGKSVNRWKLFFSDAAELKKLIDEINAQGIGCNPGDE